jgi:GTPase SAR1 family protein
METLNTHNHFAPAFGPEILFNSRFDYSDKKVQKKPLEDRSINLPERAQTKSHEKAEAKDFTICTKTVTKDTINKTIYNFQEELGSNKVHPPQSAEPPKITTSPVTLLPDSFETDLHTVSDPEFGEREFFMRCVLIGAKDTGKHELIRANFTEDKNEVPHAKTGVNFVNKFKKNYNTWRKYHFWVNTLSEDDSITKQVVWKTYYKYANAFVFVYDTTNKKSFEALEKAVKSVLEVVPQEQFFGILLGTKNDLKEQREVDCEDIINFRQKYNFTYYTETNSTQEREKSQLIPRLNTKLKCTFEAI